MKTKILISSIAALFALPVSAGPFDGLFGLSDTKTDTQPAKSGSKDSGTKASSSSAPADLKDYTQILSQKMTAKELFAKKGMYATLNLAQSLAADAKAGKNGMFMDSMGAISMDLGATLRLASRLAAPYLSYAALEKLMTSFSENPTIMDSVSIDVPQVGMLNPQLNEDLLGVARFLVAMKASNQLVIESEKSLETAKTRYKQLMQERDEKTADLGRAHLLMDGTTHITPEQSKSKVISAQDYEYLQSFNGKPLEETLKDQQATYLIDAILKDKYPGEYKSIIAGEKEVASHYSEYAKTSVGTLSMLGFASVFLNSVIDMGNRSPVHQLLLVPMAKDGVIELLGIVKNVISALSRNDELVEGTFSLTVDGNTKSGIKASKVLKSLSDDQLTGFRNAMIGNDANSYLTKLDHQSSTYAADIMDRLVDRDAKEAFAKTALARENPDTFSFKTAFATNIKPNKAKDIDTKDVKTRLYEKNQETTTDETDMVFGKLQTMVKKDITSLTNQDMRRIMMLGDHKQSLAIGNAIVRLEQPGLQGLAEQYETRTATLPMATQDVLSKKKTDGQSKPAKAAQPEKSAAKPPKSTTPAKPRAPASAPK